MKLSASFYAFLGGAIVHCVKNKTNVKLVSAPKVEGCMGYYQPPDIFVAMENPGWHLVFVHEYAHFLQDLDEKQGLDPGYEHITHTEYSQWAKWTKGQGYVVKDITRLRKLIQRMERDAERRSLGLIERHSMFDCINKAEYTRKANSYILFYTFLERHCKKGGWYSVAPYLVPSIVDMMPKDRLFNDDELEILPEEYVREVKAHCMKKRV